MTADHVKGWVFASSYAQAMIELDALNRFLAWDHADSEA